jgi:hypothetical protein
VEIEGVNLREQNISIKIPFTMLKDPNTKILVLHYSNDNFEVKDGEGLVQESGENCYTVNSKRGG